MTSPLYKHAKQMPVIDFNWPALTEYDHIQANVRPVEATAIELGHKIEQLENDLAFEKTSVLYAQQASQRLIDENRDWEVKFRNLEFANRNLQAQVDKIPTLKRTIRYMMAEHLDIELGDK